MQVYVVVNKKNSRVAGVYSSFAMLMAVFAPAENGTLRIDPTAQGAVFYREFETFEATIQEVIE
jgi:hypothetical protein